jgi:transcriptional regulator with XRE-family HTH domain
MDNKLFEYNRLKETLESIGLTQAKLARLCGQLSESISVGTINKICSNKIAVSRRHKNIIIKVLNEYQKDKIYSASDVF